MSDCAKYVHEFQTRYGQTRYAVAEWDAFNGRYIRPLDEIERDSTDCSIEFAEKLENIQSFSDYRQALWRARHLFYEIEK